MVLYTYKQPNGWLEDSVEKPELKRMLGERRAAVEAQQAEVRRKFGEHMAVLEELEKLGFNLDVASDVYDPEQLLDPEDKSGLIAKWAELLKAIKQNPGLPLLLIKSFDVQTTGCTGLGANARYEKDVAWVLIYGVDEDDITFSSTEPVITISSDKGTMDRGTKRVRGKLHPLREATNKIVVGSTHGVNNAKAPIFDFGDTGVTVIYNPTADDMMYKASGQSGHSHEAMMKVCELRGEM